MKVIDPFSNVADQPIEGSIYGSQISNFNSLEIGAGAKTMKVDESGLWLGADQFADAPFRVDMSGNIYASSVTLTQYVLAVGGSYTSASSGARVVILPDANNGIVAYASNGTSVVFQVVVGGASVGDVVIGNYAGGYGALWDQSAGVLYIKGDIVAGNIDASRLTAGTLNVNRISAGSITGGSSGKIAETTITDYNISSLNANKITAGTIDASVITVSNISATNIVTGTLSADRISGGTLTVGGSSNTLGIISVKNSSNTEIARLNNSGVIVRNTRGLFFEETTGGQYWDLQVNSSNQAVMSLPSTNQFFLKNYAGDTNLFTVSSSQTYSEVKIVANGGIEMNNNTIYEISMANFQETSSRPNDNDGIWYYKSGGSYEFRSRMEGGNWKFDQSGA